MTPRKDKRIKSVERIKRVHFKEIDPDLGITQRHIDDTGEKWNK